MKEYKITEEQFEQLTYFKRMFEFNAQLVEDVCKEEKRDIEYGFELGKIHSNLRKHFIDMEEFENEIKLGVITYPEDNGVKENYNDTTNIPGDVGRSFWDFLNGQSNQQI